jgi:dienelactone hydrolase
MYSGRTSNTPSELQVEQFSQMKRVLLFPALLVSTLLSLDFGVAGVRTKEVTYKSGETTMKGFLAWDDDKKGRRPGVLIVHEWWGLNDYARERAKEIAALGYTGLALDMYGEGKIAEHPKDAGAFATAVMKDPETAKARFMAALQFLKDQPTVDPDKIAAIGYCFGGAVVLNMARTGVDLDAVASFHGSLGELVPVSGKIKPKILVAHGADDSFATEEQVETFKEEMKGADMEFISYKGAKHGFTNPAADEAAKKFGLDVAYNKEADEKSWAALKTLLKDAFGQ